MDHTALLDPIELSSVHGAVESRRREFSTGRVMARRALERLGRAPVPIRRAPDRSPDWPEGFVGSISHTRGYCAVAVSSGERYGAIGLDIEVESDVRAHLARHLATAEELTALQATGVSEALAVAIAFTAKEAFYKSQYPLTGRLLDFLDVSVALDPTRSEFRVRPLVPLSELGRSRSYPGRVARCCGLIAAGIVIPPPGPGVR